MEREEALRKEIAKVLPDAERLVLEIEARQQALKRVVTARWRKDEGVAAHERDEEDTVLDDASFGQVCAIIDDLGGIAATTAFATFMRLPTEEINASLKEALKKVYDIGPPPAKRGGHVSIKKTMRHPNE